MNGRASDSSIAQAFRDFAADYLVRHSRASSFVDHIEKRARELDASGGSRPANCRMALQAAGKPYPRSGCEACKDGGLRGCPYDNAAPRAAEAVTTNSAQVSSEVVVGDTERLDWIERTYSGMTNRERYLPVVMIWGKGANGRTLREAIDKYMAKETPFTGVTFVERDMPPGVVAEVRTRYDRVTIVESDDDAAMGAVGAGGGS